MKKLSRALAITLLAATVPATIVLADPEPGDQQKSEQSEVKRGPSPETLARLEDGRVAMAKAALKLSPDQEKLFVPVEEKIRAGFADRRKAREAKAAKREERRANKGERENQQASLPDRIEKRSQRLTQAAAKMTERAQKAKEYADVLKPFYAALSDEQKAVASQVLGHFGQDGRGRHGPRWAMGHDGGRGGRAWR
jgi:hypothetical protein